MTKHCRKPSHSLTKDCKDRKSKPLILAIQIQEALWRILIKQPEILIKLIILLARKASCLNRGQRKCSGIGGQILPTRINNNHRKLICISRTIYDLSVWNKPLIDTCHYSLTSWANQALRSMAITGFQNWGVCLQAFPSFPSPPFIFWLSFHFSRGQNRESCFWVFLCSKTKWRHLLRRLESQWCYIGFLSPFICIWN